MPFTGELGGEIVWPDDVEDGATVTCPECNDSMHVRSGHTTRDGVLKPRCFAHDPDAAVGGMCPGGESDQHKLMKYVVSRRLHQMFDHATVNREQSIPTTNRIGDVVATFNDPIEPFGRGVVVEVQYRNDQKDIEAVTTDYLRAGYSVYWLKAAHFGENFETVEFPDIIPVWPNAVPTVGEWEQISESVTWMEHFGEPRREMEIKMPPEYFEDHSTALKRHWSIGSKRYDFDLVRPLSESSATRSCATCGGDATVYVFQDGVISTFRCDDHMPENTADGT